MGLTAEEQKGLIKILGKIQPEQAGYLAKINEELEKTSGFLAEIDAKFASGTAIGKFFAETAGRVFGGLPDQLISYSEELRKSVAGNEEFISSLIKQRNEIIDLGKETAKFGVGTKDNLLIMREMSRESLKLLPIYQKNAVALVDFSSRMKAFGVETSESNNILKSLAGNLDMTGDQLDETRRKLVEFAKQTGQGVSEVMKDYGGAIKGFMDFLDPNEMNKAYMQFQVMAKRMGTETNSLLDFAQKFDTISGAQETGARLNQTFSALGVEFNALALQEMEPEARVRYISDRVKEGLRVARGLGPKGGRMIMGSLKEAMGLDAATIRALEAEGGGARSITQFEKMGGALTSISREEEAARARRENAPAVDRAMAEERMLQAVMTTKAFEKLDKLADDFGAKMLKASEMIDPTKQKAIDALVEKEQEAFGKLVQDLDDLFSGQRKLQDVEKEYLEKAGVDVTKIKTVKDLLTEVNNTDPEKLKAALKNPAFAKELIDAFMESVKQEVTRQMKTK